MLHYVENIWSLQIYEPYFYRLFSKEFQGFFRTLLLFVITCCWSYLRSFQEEIV